MTKYPQFRWALKAPGVRAVQAKTMSARDEGIRDFTVRRGLPVHVLEYRTDAPGEREKFVRTWTVEPKGRK